MEENQIPAEEPKKVVKETPEATPVVEVAEEAPV
jgi:hypothetical protein